jgi:hypothetical protein
VEDPGQMAGLTDYERRSNYEFYFKIDTKSMKPRSNPFVRTALAAFSLAFTAMTAHAAFVTWAGVSGGDWNTGTNWSTTPAKPANADTAVFNLTGITSVTNATADQIITGITFDTAIASTGAFTLGTTTPHFPAIRSGHRIFQRPSAGKQFPSNQ